MVRNLVWSFVFLVLASFLRVALAERGIEAVLILQNDDIHRYDEVLSALTKLGLTPLHALALTQEVSDLGFGVLAKGSTAQAEAAQAFLSHATSVLWLARAKKAEATSLSSAQASTTTTRSTAVTTGGAKGDRGGAGRGGERIAGNAGGGGMKSVVLSTAAIDAEALRTLQRTLLNQHSLKHPRSRTKTRPSVIDGGDGDGGDSGGNSGRDDDDDDDDDDGDGDNGEDGRQQAVGMGEEGEPLQCPRWALAGCCSRLPLLMHAHCAHSCVALGPRYRDAALALSGLRSVAESAPSSSSSSWLGEVFSVVPGLLAQALLLASALALARRLRQLNFFPDCGAADDDPLPPSSSASPHSPSSASLSSPPVSFVADRHRRGGRASLLHLVSTALLMSPFLGEGVARVHTHARPLVESLASSSSSSSSPFSDGEGVDQDDEHSWHIEDSGLFLRLMDTSVVENDAAAAAAAAADTDTDTDTASAAATEGGWLSDRTADLLSWIVVKAMALQAPVPSSSPEREQQQQRRRDHQRHHLRGVLLGFLEVCAAIGATAATAFAAAAATMAAKTAAASSSSKHGGSFPLTAGGEGSRRGGSFSCGQAALEQPLVAALEQPLVAAVVAIRKGCGVVVALFATHSAGHVLVSCCYVALVTGSWATAASALSEVLVKRVGLCGGALLWLAHALKPETTAATAAAATTATRTLETLELAVATDTEAGGASSPPLSPSPSSSAVRSALVLLSRACFSFTLLLTAANNINFRGRSRGRHPASSAAASFAPLLLDEDSRGFGLMAATTNTAMPTREKKQQEGNEIAKERNIKGKNLQQHPTSSTSSSFSASHAGKNLHLLSFSAARVTQLLAPLQGLLSLPLALGWATLTAAPALAFLLALETAAHAAAVAATAAALPLRRAAKFLGKRLFGRLLPPSSQPPPPAAVAGAVADDAVAGDMVVGGHVHWASALRHLLVDAGLVGSLLVLPALGLDDRFASVDHAQRIRRHAKKMA